MCGKKFSLEGASNVAYEATTSVALETTGVWPRKQHKCSLIIDNIVALGATEVWPKRRHIV